MKNIENCKLVLKQIKEHPETWNQKKWHCGTSHCFAGWAQILSGKEPDQFTVRKDARVFLGLSRPEANYYFAGSRTLEELETVTKDFYDQDGLDPDGYNQEGYDQEGYDHRGYNCYGYNWEGYNCYGFNREGYNQEGYDDDNLDKNNNPKS